jgi:streptomycin 6-kinase
MTDEFVQHALSNGEEGAQWLKKIPEIITKYEKKWAVRVAPPFKLSYNYVAPAIRKDGSPAVIKIGFPKDREFQSEIDALAVFDGQANEKLLESDKESAVILIERVIPGISLSSLDDDEEATRILASLMKKLWKPLPPNNNFITLSEWSQAIPQYKEKYKGQDGHLSSYLVDKAENLFKELIATSAEPMLVHGDLHHDNVLSSDRNGWLTIDPKGVAAEPAYETAAMIRNPYEKMKNRADLQNIISKRIRILSEELQLDAQRIHQWCLAQTVLSAVWNYQGVKGSDHAITIAEALDSLKI